VFQDAEKKGLSQDQAQELANEYLFLPSESLPEDAELEEQKA
jgi:hypothetical protein